MYWDLAKREKKVKRLFVTLVALRTDGLTFRECYTWNSQNHKGLILLQLEKLYWYY